MLIIVLSLFLGMCGIVLIPLFLYLLPVHSLTVCHSLSLAQSLISLSFLGMLLLHGLYGCLVEHQDAPTSYAFMQVLRSKGLPLYVEVSYVKFKAGAQGVPHHFLLKARACHLTGKELSYDVYLSL